MNSAETCKILLALFLNETHAVGDYIRTDFFLGVISNAGKVVGRRINRFTDILVYGVQYP